MRIRHIKVSYETAYQGEKGTLDIGNNVRRRLLCEKSKKEDTVYTIGKYTGRNLQFQLSSFVSLDTVPSNQQRQSEKKLQLRKMERQRHTMMKMIWHSLPEDSERLR